MLELKIVFKESYDETKQEFIATDSRTIQLEHSLVSLSKWESKHKIPFLTEKEKTDEQVIDYVRCMILDKTVDPEVTDSFSERNWKEIQEYMIDTPTATWFNESSSRQKKSTETITSELIYYWMTAYQIPLEAERWNLARLFTLIRIHIVKNTPPDKKNRADLNADRRALNEQRKAKYGTSG